MDLPWSGVQGGETERLREEEEKKDEGSCVYRA